MGLDTNDKELTIQDIQPALDEDILPFSNKSGFVTSYEFAKFLEYL